MGIVIEIYLKTTHSHGGYFDNVFVTMGKYVLSAMIDHKRFLKSATEIIVEGALMALIYYVLALLIAIVFASSFTLIDMHTFLEVDINEAPEVGHRKALIGLSIFILFIIALEIPRKRYSVAGNRIYNKLSDKLDVIHIKNETNGLDNNTILRYYFVMLAEPFLKLSMAILGGLLIYSYMIFEVMNSVSFMQLYFLISGTLFVGTSSIGRVICSYLSPHPAHKVTSFTLWASIVGFSLLSLSAILEFINLFNINVWTVIILSAFASIIYVSYKISNKIMYRLF